MPGGGHMPLTIQKLRDVYSNRTVSSSDVYITCEGTVCALVKNKTILHFL
jgi:hypothetical protein